MAGPFKQTLREHLQLQYLSSRSEAIPKLYLEDSQGGIPPMPSFQAMLIPPNALDKYLQTPTFLQMQAIPLILSQKSCMLVSPTCTGKTLSYMIPLIIYASLQLPCAVITDCATELKDLARKKLPKDIQKQYLQICRHPKDLDLKHSLYSLVIDLPEENTEVEQWLQDFKNCQIIVTSKNLRMPPSQITTIVIYQENQNQQQQQQLQVKQQTTQKPQDFSLKFAKSDSIYKSISKQLDQRKHRKPIWVITETDDQRTDLYYDLKEQLRDVKKIVKVSTRDHFEYIIEDQTIYVASYQGLKFLKECQVSKPQEAALLIISPQMRFQTLDQLEFLVAYLCPRKVQYLLSDSPSATLKMTFLQDLKMWLRQVASGVLEVDPDDEHNKKLVPMPSLLVDVQVDQIQCSQCLAKGKHRQCNVRFQ